VFAQAKKDKDINKRLCGKLTEFIQHEESIKYLDNKVHKRGEVCYWCGNPTWTYCGVCKDPITKEPLMLHHCPRTGKGKGKCCFTHAHNEEGFGLAQKRSRVDWEEAKKLVATHQEESTGACEAHSRSLYEAESNDL
jgi:hypothetical protein